MHSHSMYVCVCGVRVCVCVFIVFHLFRMQVDWSVVQEPDGPNPDARLTDLILKEIDMQALDDLCGILMDLILKGNELFSF